MGVRGCGIASKHSTLHREGELRRSGHYEHAMVCGELTPPPAWSSRSHRPGRIEHPPAYWIRQFCCGVIGVRCRRGTRAAHPEKMRTERHLRSSRTFQRDRLSPTHAVTVSVREPERISAALRGAECSLWRRIW